MFFEQMVIYFWRDIFREFLLKGMNQYGLPPRTSWFGSVAFKTENMLSFFIKQAILMRYMTVTMTVIL